MTQIISILQEQIKEINVHEILEFGVLNPDLHHAYNGNTYLHDNINYIHRGYKSWLDLAQILSCKMLTPKESQAHTICIRYKKLNHDTSFHTQINDKEEKYGSNSIFNEIDKNEESAFIFYYLQALHNAGVDSRTKILNLGVNSGDEFEAIISKCKDISKHKLVGIDYCQSAIDQAKQKFKNYLNISLYTHDINDLESLNLGEFDLIISIGTLQSTNLSFNKVLMNVVQKHLKKDGAIILGFPNCRWIDGEMIYGARVKNYPFSEMGLLYKDVIFSKKYLQQKKFRVTITGKDYIFLTGTSIRK